MVLRYDDRRMDRIQGYETLLDRGEHGYAEYIHRASDGLLASKAFFQDGSAHYRIDYAYDTLIDAEVQYADGTVEAISGTP